MKTEKNRITKFALLLYRLFFTAKHSQKSSESKQSFVILPFEILFTIFLLFIFVILLLIKSFNLQFHREKNSYKNETSSDKVIMQKRHAKEEKFTKSHSILPKMVELSFSMKHECFSDTSQ
jgi:uncharacterized membrane protein